MSSRGLEVKLQSGGRSGVLVVVFSQVRIPSGKFGLERLFAKTQHACVVLNDTTSQWYLDAEQEIDQAIDLAITQEQPERIIYYGASMGAYGALITGLRRQDGEIYAFSPELELGTAGTQSADYLARPAPDKLELLGPLAGDLRHPVHLLFGLFDWVDTCGYLAVQRLPESENLNCYGIAGPHALHDQLYSLNTIRQLIKTFQRDIAELLADKNLLNSQSLTDCEVFAQLGHALACGEVPSLEASEALRSNPGYGLLEAEWLALLGKHHDGAELLREWHEILHNDAVMRTAPKRWRKAFLMRAAELYLQAGQASQARDALADCIRLFPVDENMRELAGQLDIVVQAPY
ncbi:hypothetical protein SAMN05444141_103379 [Pseudovibrio denitrificans]|uniref:Uncharacterized protein n=1 Tax=Pseudovibrio denitrificans TaxID=258256 RepID=A0A1I7AUR6_9HYPH|nr:hypothetical protein [Pseudovibrio denitrificans]SFT78672.1 hypothetical protein SAMN05444141_103379 [Pseudovibrio denitrificans]